MVDWSVCHNAVSHTSKLPSEHVFILSKTLFEIFEFFVCAEFWQFLQVCALHKFYVYRITIEIKEHEKCKTCKQYISICTSTCAFLFPFLKKGLKKCGDLALFAAAWSTFYYRNPFLRYIFLFLIRSLEEVVFFDIQYFI